MTNLASLTVDGETVTFTVNDAQRITQSFVILLGGLLAPLQFLRRGDD